MCPSQSVWLVGQRPLTPAAPHLGTFHEDDVRPDTVDRSSRRGVATEEAG